MAAGGKLEEVEAVDAAELDNGEVAEGAFDADICLVDDEEANGGTLEALALWLLLEVVMLP